MSDLEAQIQSRINAFVNELSALVREAALESVRDALGGAPPRRGPGRPPKAGRAIVHVAVKPARAHAPAGGGRRSPEQIKANVGKVLDYIKAHPACRSEFIRRDLKLPRTTVRDALDRLMEAKKLAMKGTRRAAKYTAK